MKLIETEGVEGIDNDQSALRAELDAELRGAATLASLYRVAETYARVRHGSEEAHDLVWEAAGDFLLGKATYDRNRAIGPQLKELVQRHAKRWRASSKQRDALRPEFMPVDAAPIALSADVALRIAAADDPEAVDSGEWVSRIRELANGDGPAQQLLALYDRGVISRRDVLAAGMTDWAYRVARERLADYATQARSAASTMAPPLAASPRPSERSRKRRSA